MKKNILYVILGLMGLMGTLAIGVVSAETTISEPYGHIDYMLNENEPFEAKVITITDGTDTITILDRNLGAKKAGTGCEDPNWGSACAGGDDTYGYHFQRGNNYGFDPLDTSIKENAKSVSSDGVVWSDIYDNSGYYGTTFIKGDSSHGYDYWGDSTSSSSNHENLRGGGGDYNDTNNGFGKNNENRRGPCPEGFHVPSYGELQKLQSMLNADGKRNKDTLRDKLLIPFAGYRYYNDASVYNMGYYAYLWSSSPYSASYPYSRILGLLVDGGLSMFGYSRATALSIRCFYDSYQPFTQSFTLSFTGSEGGSISTGSIEAEKGSFISRDDEAGSVTISGTVVATGISDEGYVFSGWLTDCDGDTVTTGCSFTGVFKLIPYTITYLGTGDDYVPSATGFTIKSNDITLTEPNKTGYTFTGRSGTNIEGITGTVTISGGSTGDRIYEANWEANEYEIVYELDGGVNNSKNVTGYTIEDTVTFENPIKEGFTFDGWFTDAQFTTGITSISTGTTGPITVYAKWTENKKSSGSSGGGGSSRTSSNSEKSTEGQAGSQQPLSPQQASDSSPNREQTVTPLIGGDGEARGGSTQNYTQEFQDAYEFAKEKGITTMPTINEANMNGKLTRIAMAKMLSQYAMNVLGQKPANIVTPKFNDVTDKQNSDYDDGVSLAYQLGIMGQNMPNNKFRPNDEVTRAEFATALSRMLYNTSDGEYKSTPKYYIHHMEKLVKEGIITKDDPNMKELRGYVMIMLMRSAK